MKLDFSPEALKEKYRVEREKRMRADGNDQYADFSGVFADFERDPYVETEIARERLIEETDVVVIGGGFGGMLAAARLRQAGVDTFRIVEKGGDFGGTWYWNRYPGAACDVESYIYLPLLEETGYIPTEKYAKAPEIFAYCQLFGRFFNLYENALFQTLVKGVAWDEASARWLVETDRGDRLSAKFVVIAGGVLHKPKLPGIPGIETFKGHSFHTSRWDYGYTGGGPRGGLDKLTGKRVGIIGTGATSIQAIPHLGASAGHLHVFQRTPSGVGPRGNRPTDPAWAQSLQPGWQQQRVENFTAIVSGRKAPVDLVGDGWTDIFNWDLAAFAENSDDPAELVQLADFQKMERIRARIHDVVQDPATAEALKPYYNQMCKRPCFHDEYLETFNRPNVTLVDTNGKGVERITETGAVVDGVEYELDCLIYASGFEVTTGYTRRLGFDIVGRGGIPLSEAWAGGASTLHGMFARGFPNLAMFSAIQGGWAINFVHVLTETSRHAAYVIKRALDMGVRTVEPTPEAQDAWMNVIFSHIMENAAFHMECTPGYFNNEGRREMRLARNAAFMGGTIEYLEIIRAWREQDDLAGLELVGAETGEPVLALQF